MTELDIQYLAHAPLVISVGLLITVIIVKHIIERKFWNKGISPTGEKWNCKYKDFFRRLYTDSEENRIWISLPWIDRK
jgi:hypothetical protein